MLNSHALRALAQPSVFERGAVLPYAEVERRLTERRAAIAQLGLAVPSDVRIIDPFADSFTRAERRWLEGE